MAQPLLSVGMIFKNEIRCLERCLKALEPLRAAIPCELVMADTGASDGSRAVAERYADLLFDFPWVNDFSAARNAVMDRATGTWFLALDADEDLDADIHELVEFLRSDETADYGFCQVCQRNYVFPDNKEVYNDFFAYRMIRMDTGLRYHGAVHESFLAASLPVKRLSGVILHHDGYIAAGGIMQSKTERNMPLLEKELRQAPYSTGRIVQCIESARNPAERRKYLRRGLQVIQRGKSKTPGWDPVIYRYAVKEFQDNDLDYGLELLAEGKEKYPESIFLQIDGEGFALQSCYAQKRYREAAEHGTLWLEALQKLDDGTLDTGELGLSILHSANAAVRSITKCMLFECYGFLEEWESAGQTLSGICPDYLSSANWVALIRSVFKYSEHLEHLTPQLNRFWETACQYADERKEGWTDNRAFLLTAFNVQFTPVNGPIPGIRSYIAQMEDCEPGRSARIAMAFDADEIKGELAKVQCWGEVLYAVYPHVMAAGVDFPDSFYQKGVEFLAEIAVQIPQYDTSFTQTVLEYSERKERWADPVKLTWLYDVTLAALRRETWEDRAICRRLCAQFRETAGLYLNQLYNRERLNAHDVCALPGMHRFSWYCLQAQEALETGNSGDCARLLKDALEAAPAMKAVVKFLTDEAERREKNNAIVSAPPELLTLAQQVRGILDAYPADDPAVAELKKSAVYQRVAFLLEKPAGYGGIKQ